MKETIKTSRTAGYLEKIFRKANEKWFNNELEEPIITIQNTKGAYGHVTVGKEWTVGQDGEQRHELNIGAATMNRPIENIVATLVHEMVHLYDLKNNIKDVSRNGSYHNRKFKEKAEQCGLIIEHDKKYGWTITSPSEEMIQFCIDNDLQDIRINRNPELDYFTIGKGGATGGISVPKTKNNSRKYVCKCCGLIVRATRDMTGKLKCVDCDEILIED